MADQGKLSYQHAASETVREARGGWLHDADLAG